MCVCVYVCVCVCVCECHPQTDCFVVSQVFSVVRHVGRLKLGNPPNFTSDRSANKRTTPTREL